MDMRMQAEVLAPGMENTNGTTLYPVMTITERTQRVPYRSEQIIVKPFAIQHTNAMECLRNCEYNMKMIDPIGMIHSLLNPECLIESLALWAVAITTAVVTDLIFTTMVAVVLMPTQG
jgi:hypothetical protein